jgi:hypothetical protein
MSSSKKPLKIVQKLIRQVWQLSRTITKKLMSFLLRGLLVFGRKSPRFSGAGFILPTVAMVLLVVALLTTAIVFRSMDRTKNASNVRINEKVLAAVSPAVDRAEAKIVALLADPTLPRSTPTDQALYQAMTGQLKLKQYTLGDETPLKLVNDFDGSGGIQGDPTAVSLDNLESLSTAWRFPVDTDNNGSFDSYSLYGIYFRNPTQSASNTRARNPLEARNPPVDNASANRNCGAGTAASLVGTSGWYKTSDGNLKKSFFVFAATVPITDTTGLDPSKYEKYIGNKGFAALEVQQDQARVPLTNNAVVYDDDLEITPGTSINLNGRIMTNSNFFIGQRGSPIRFYQVSSPDSCFYTAENGKITVGGNVVLGSVDPVRPTTPVTVDLFRNNSPSTADTFEASDGSVRDPAKDASYNSQAYTQRIAQLVRVSQDNAITPNEVQLRIDDGTDAVKALQDYYKERTRRVPFAEDPDPNSPALTNDTTPPTGSVQTDDIRPRNEWHYPTDLATGTATNSLTLEPTKPEATDPDVLGTQEERLLGDRILVGNGLPAKWWNGQKFVDNYDIRDRQAVGVPWTGASTPRTRKTQFVPLSDLGDTDRDGFWEQAAAKPPEQSLDAIGGLRVVTGAGIYDLDPAGGTFLPRPTFPLNLPVNLHRDNPTDNLSTGDANEADQGFKVALPDSMPMWEDTNQNGSSDLYNSANPANSDRQGDLIMRATAVYHYRESSYPNSGGTDTPYPDPSSAAQKPIACVSSYYNPSTKITAQNRQTLQDGSPAPTWTADPSGNSSPISPSGDTNANGLSNNGISYPVPPDAIDPATSVGAGGRDISNGYFDSPAPVRPLEAGSLRAKLNYQANLIFPDGRFVNEPLRAALIQIDNDSTRLTLAHQSSLAAAICALNIADGTLGPNDSVIPHGTIYETSFLDARQVKALEDPNQQPTEITNDYDLSIEQRQPLEIRATVLDLEKLRKKAIAGQAPMNTVVLGDEYLLPDSGIIYATREDALLDLSVDPTAVRDMGARKLNSPVDFILDPTRRPNGIMLINGTELARGGDANEYKPEEKGLILATNLPAYVKANARGFNLHQNASSGAPLEEFREPLTAGFGNFYTGRSTPEPLFACRKNQPGLNCDPGDLWRPATVLADSVTLLSNNFRFGFRNEGDYDLRKNVDTLDNNLVLGGYDFNGIGGPLATDPVNENLVGFDLNGNNTATDTNVPETEITVSAARKLNGFFDNNYLTSADWFNKTGTNSGFPKDFDTSTGSFTEGSSYVNNFVTPIQRRWQFGEYVMEICRKPLVEQCGPTDWVVGYDLDGDGFINYDDPDNPNDLAEKDVMAWELVTAKEGGPDVSLADKLGAGTTARLALGFDADDSGFVEDSETEADRRYPRRVAFLRTPVSTAVGAPPAHRLVLDGSQRPVPIGINDTGQVNYYPYGQFNNIDADGPIDGTTGTRSPQSYTRFGPGNRPNRPGTRVTLWFKTTTNSVNPTTGDNYGYDNPLFYQTALAEPLPGSGVGTTEQPLLVPVLQLQLPTKESQTNYSPLNPNDDPTTVEASGKNWLQTPSNSTFNLIIAAGDTPTRNADPTTGTPTEFNGGMPNFPNFLENWNASFTATIKGSFIQVKRSAYATAPFVNLLRTANSNGGIFGYRQIYRTGNSEGRTPYYSAPIRNWGFDVGLLPQLPDAFSQRITTPSAGEPNKFYRELSRNDEWVQTLLCAGELDLTTGSVNDYAVKDDEERPRDCSPISDYN